MSTFGLGPSVKGAATPGYTPLAGEYAVVTYTSSIGAASGAPTSIGVFTAYYGPGQTVAATLVSAVNPGFPATSVAFSSGVVFANT